MPFDSNADFFAREGYQQGRRDVAMEALKELRLLRDDLSITHPASPRLDQLISKLQRE